MAQAQAELTTFTQNLQRAYPDTNKNQSMVVRTELETRIDQDPVDAALSAMLVALLSRGRAHRSVHKRGGSADEPGTRAR